MREMDMGFGIWFGIWEATLGFCAFESRHAITAFASTSDVGQRSLLSNNPLRARRTKTCSRAVSHAPRCTHHKARHLTSKMSHAHGRHDSCRIRLLIPWFHSVGLSSARGMTDVGVGSGALLGLLLLHANTRLIPSTT